MSNIATAAPTQDVTASNSLTDLAARIRAEHEASGLAIKRGLDHAIACGRLLIEARAQLEHGQWLPWLREHCGVPERSARRYMELAAYAAYGKSANLADLTIDGSAEAAADHASIEQALEAGDWHVAGDLAVRLFLDSPFNAKDFDHCDWISTKLRHQLKLPCIADWCFDVAEFTPDRRPALRICPWDELVEMVNLLAPVAARTRKKTDRTPIRFDATSFPDMEALLAGIVEVKLRAMWLLGAVLNELGHRKQISDEQYDKEWNETHQHVMAQLDQQTADRLAPCTMHAGGRS
jgi:hypothetical protein